MPEKTEIPFCDSTVNDWLGCSKVSAGCLNCFAEVFDARGCIEKVSHWGPGAPRLQLKSASKARAKLNRKPWICDSCGRAGMCDKNGVLTTGMCECRGTTTFHRRRIFNQNLGDWLDPEVPTELLVGMLESIRLADKCTHILCTKRPELFLSRMRAALNFHEEQIGVSNSRPLTLWLHNWIGGHEVPTNIWTLTSIENQKVAHQRMADLFKIPSACRGLSVEPLLEPIKFNRDDLANLEWVIIGGESGALARPCNIDWIRSIKNQCQDSNTPCFVKQLGSNCITISESEWSKFTRLRYDMVAGVPLPPARVMFKHPKGANPAEWPEDLNVRQFPNT